MEKVTLTKTTVQVVHQTALQLEQAIARYNGAVVVSGADITDPPTEGWAQSRAVFMEPRKAASFVTAVRKMEGVAEVQRRADKVAYLPLDVGSWTADRSGRLRLVLQGKSKGTMFQKEYEKDGLIYGVVGRSNPVFRYFRTLSPEPVAASGEAVIE